MAATLTHRLEGAGKGDGNRVSDLDAYRSNYDAIFNKGCKGKRKGKRRPRRGTFIVRDGHLVPALSESEFAAIRKQDSKNMHLWAMDTTPEQAKEMNRQFGHLGVKFDETTGDCICRDRQAKLALLKARGYHDRHEVRG